jgi:small redox-active disulfide protein 2
MDIKVLGPGCPRCGEVVKRIQAALAELNLQAAVEKITDIKKIMDHQIMATPGLIIDGKIKSMGRIPSAGEFKAWINEAK